ncbi:MAG: hypothetical protein P4L53_27580 [Candidatus Obscuribacterales bacterium]|nr:hypothetical protein [Candidatus Obscuribacterales bacterium]
MSNEITHETYIDVIGRLVAALTETGHSADYLDLIREANALLGAESSGASQDNLHKVD